jgi:hypothetical protein
VHRGVIQLQGCFGKSEAPSAPVSASWTIKSAPDVMPKSAHDKATFAVGRAHIGLVRWT